MENSLLTINERFNVLRLCATRGSKDRKIGIAIPSESRARRTVSGGPPGGPSTAGMTSPGIDMQGQDIEPRGHHANPMRRQPWLDSYKSQP